MKKSYTRITALVLALILPLCGCKRPPEPETVMYINGRSIAREELISYAWRFIGQVDTENTFTADDFDKVLNEDGTTLADMVLDGALEYLLINCFFAEKAAELVITLDASETAGLDGDLTELITTYGDKTAYEETLALSGMTASVNREVYLADLLSNKVRGHLFGDGGPYAPDMTDLEDYYKWNYVTVSHVLRLCMDMTTGEAYPEEVQEKALETARSVIDRYNSGEDFIALAEGLGEDDGLLQYPSRTYTFTYGDMAEEFENASFALKEGEVTPEPVKTSYGYHVIKKYPLDDGYFESNLQAITSNYAQDECEAVYNTWKSDVSIEYTANYDEIDMKQYY